MPPTNDAATILAALAHYTGTESYTRHGLMRDLLLTEGVTYLREAASAYWLVDAIASHLMTNARLRGEHFQSWTFTRETSDVGRPEQPHVLSATDGNTKRAIVRQEIPYTDFPLPEIRFYCVKADEFGKRAWVLMLPSEY